MLDTHGVCDAAPGVAHFTPSAWVESAVKTCPSVPTSRLLGTPEVPPTINAPLVVMGLVNPAAHLIPSAWAESAVRTWPLVPTGRFVGGADAPRTIRSPLAVVGSTKPPPPPVDAI